MVNVGPQRPPRRPPGCGLSGHARVLSTTLPRPALARSARRARRNRDAARVDAWVEASAPAGGRREQGEAGERLEHWRTLNKKKKIHGAEHRRTRRVSPTPAMVENDGGQKGRRGDQGRMRRASAGANAAQHGRRERGGRRGECCEQPDANACGRPRRWAAKRPDAAGRGWWSRLMSAGRPRSNARSARRARRSRDRCCDSCIGLSLAGSATPRLGAFFTLLHRFPRADALFRFSPRTALGPGPSNDPPRPPGPSGN